VQSAPGSKVLAETGADAMSDKRSKPLRRKVDVHNLSELRAWANYWGCTQQDIRDAVHSSGVMVPEVQDWLRNNVIR
jgi:hypothetical protein